MMAGQETMSILMTKETSTIGVLRVSRGFSITKDRTGNSENNLRRNI